MSSEPIPSLAGLRAFVTVAGLGTFTQAGAELGLTQAAVSYLVATLEAALGVALLERSRPRVRLTAPGRTYLEFATAALLQVEAGRHALQRQAESDGNVLRIGVTEAFATLWLVPRLHRFQQIAPDAQVVITSWIGDRANDRRMLDREEVQACITYALPETQRPEVTSRFLAADYALPVCSPAVAAGIGTVADLAGQRLIHALAGPNLWHNWLVDAGAGDLTPADQMHLQHSALCVQAAMAGLGVAMAHSVLVSELIRGGSLAVPLPLMLPLEKRYSLLFRARRAGEPLIGVFAEWLAAELAADAAAPSLAGMSILGA